MILSTKQHQGAQNYRSGRQAEAMAADYLQRQGYHILHTRYRNSCGEIDLIAYKEARLYFVEVKARKSFEEGLYALSGRQQKRLMQTAQLFVAEHPQYLHAELQFDLIVIAGWQLHHEAHILVADA